MEPNRAALIVKLCLYPTVLIFGGWIIANWNYYYNAENQLAHKKEIIDFQKKSRVIQNPEKLKQQRAQLEAKWAELRSKQKIKDTKPSN